MNQVPHNRSFARAEAVSYDEGLRQYMLGIYNYMAGGVGLTAVVAYLFGNVPFLINLLYQTNAEGYLQPTLLAYAAMFAPLIFLMGGMRMHKISAAQAQGRFWLFAALMGMSMGSIFLVFSGESIARVLLITATSFGALSLYGYTTKKDLTGFGSFLIMGAWGLFFGFLVNMFMQSGTLHFAMSALGVLVFAGLTAYDTQMLRRSYNDVAGNGEAAQKMAVFGALSLYLDFINLFQFLLQFMGNRD